MTLAAGVRLGPYEVVGPLGAGGMGEVYKARDTRLGRTVALKVLPAGAASDAKRRHRFEQEARAASALNHPHICVLHDIGCETPAPDTRPAAATDGPVPFLVMEYLDGQTLADRLCTGPLSLAQALEIGAQIADALATAHRHGIVHRDLKPANVMLTKSSGALQAKLLDFGLAKLKAPSAQPGADLSALSTQDPSTTPGAVMGTLPYMAPEQLEGKEADARTDLFAFGCVLYEMLTGRRAFAGKTKASVISAIMTSEPAPVTSLQPVTPPALERLVTACLAKDPDERRQSAHDLAEDLRGITNEEGARRPPASSSSHESDAPALRRRATPQRLAFGLSAIALVVLAVAAYLSPWLRSSEPTLLRAVPSQLTTAPGLQAEPAVSPDGSLVAFVSDEGGTPRRVTNGAGAYRVRWSRPERMLVSGSWGGATVSVRIVNPRVRNGHDPEPACSLRG